MLMEPETVPGAATLEKVSLPAGGAGAAVAAAAAAS